MARKVIMVGSIVAAAFAVSKAKDLPAPSSGHLPEQHHKYFDLSQPHKMMNVADLKPSKPPESQPKSVENAQYFMEQASSGAMGKRGPITAVRHPDGTHTVTDGNATYGVAKKHNWKQLPVRVVDQHEVSKAIQHLGMPPAHNAVPAPASPPAIRQQASASAAHMGDPMPHGPGPTPAAAPTYKPKPLFSHEEIAKGDPKLGGKKPSQPTNDPHTLWAQAAVADNDLHEALNRGSGYSNHAGMGVVDGGAAPHKDAAPEDHQAFEANRAAAMQNPKGAVMFGPLKTAKRSEEKLAAERDNPNDPLPYHSLLDVSRATVMADKHHDLHEAIAHVTQHMQRHGFELVRAKDKYQKPEETGYRGVLTNWRHHSGHVAEVQFSDRDMQAAKDGAGHHEYEATRAIDDRMKAEKRKERTSEEEATYQHHMANQQRIYGGAWDAQIAKHSHLAKAGDLGTSYRVKLQRRNANMSQTATDPHVHPTTGYFLYDDTKPAYVHPRRVPEIWTGTHWKPMYDSRQFHENAERVSKAEWDKACKAHGAHAPEGTV